MRTILVLSAASAVSPFLTSSSASAQDVVRTMVQEDVVEESVWSDAMVFLTRVVEARLDTLDPLAAPSLGTLSSVRVNTEITREVELNVRGVVPMGTTVQFTLESDYGISCGVVGSGCADGSHVGFDVESDPSDPIGPGELRTITHISSESGASEVSAGDPLWPAVLSSIGPRASDSLFLYDLYAFCQAAACPIELVDVVLRGRAQVRVESDYVLPLLASTAYCSSPPNSTGVTPELGAYGSLERHDQWLSVVGDGFPEGAPGILFFASNATSIPAGSYNICVGETIRRVGGTQVAEGGRLQFDVDLLSVPGGQSVYMQVLHRDPVLGVAASNGIVVIAE